MTRALSTHKRVVVKIGSALLVDQATGLRTKWLQSLADDITRLQKAGVETLVVSSGAIALGRTLLKLPPRALKLDESQAAAAVGQIQLARAWNAALAIHGIHTGQILLTLEDTETRHRYLNARATLSELLRLKTVPVINENDTVATSEIRYGDNDRLAARVASMIGADLLVLLSDIDGLYTAPPASNPNAVHLPLVEDITPEIEAMAGDAGTALSRGGMRTKIDAARIATQAGTAMIIAKGAIDHPLAAIDEGAKSTYFTPSTAPTSAWKSWIAGQLEPRGTLTVDAGAASALANGKSLLAAGIKQTTGDYKRGDTVAIVEEETGQMLGRGLVGYGAQEINRIAGHQSGQIEELLGYAPRAAVIHRDDLALE